MATIVIKDLSESVELDRQAMLAISGGARSRGGSAFVRPRFRPGFLADPGGFARARLIPARPPAPPRPRG